MASIRRTLSPYNDRPYQNGGNLFSVESPTHKGKVPSPLLTLGFGVRRFVSVVFVQKQSRKGVNSWKRSLCWCLIFFCIGFLLGMAPFGEVEDIKGFEDRFVARPVENVEIEGRKDVPVLDRPPENIGLDRVELGAVDMKYGEEGFDFVPRKQLILVTPTYNRALQAYFLNRLGQTLRLVPPPILWIVVEMNAASSETADILRKTGVMYRHLVCSKNLTNVKDRGVHQRNTALELIERHKLDGIVYFADDDNIYSLELFEKMREIR